MLKSTHIKKLGFLLISIIFLSCGSDDGCTCKGKFLGPEGVVYGEIVDCYSGEPYLSQEINEGNPTTFLGCED